MFRDIKECFDSLWPKKTLLDLYDNGIDTNLLNVLDELTKEVHIKIKTPVGVTEERTITDVILQGETLSSILCTNTVDRISKECKIEAFKYKETISIPKMGFVDDILDVTKCGKETVEMNQYTRNSINERKLQQNQDKCVRMHIGKKEKECEKLDIDIWKAEEVDSDGEVKFEDKYEGVSQIKTVTHHLYLGDSVMDNGSNKMTIESRISKAQGIIRDIIHVLENSFFGEFYFEALKLLRNSMVTSVLTYNLEVAFNLTKSEVKLLDKIDIQLLKMATSSSSKISRCLLLLDLGLMSVDFHIKQKRINYLHRIISSNDSSLVKSVMEKQIENPQKGDWIVAVKEDLKEMEIKFSFEEIASMSKKKFKSIVKQACQQACFKSLKNDKLKLSKGKEIEYTELKTQHYFKPGNNLSADSMRWIFKIRSRDLPIRGNFPGAQSENKCAIEQCPEKLESQFHLFTCPFLSSDNQIMSNDVSYTDIFLDNVAKQYEVMLIMKSRFIQRNRLLSNCC